MLQNVHYTLNTVVAYTLHTVANKCTSGCNRLCLPPENLALSWLSHSASILTHLNESVSRSSVGGGYHTPLFVGDQQLLQYKYLLHTPHVYPETESPKYNLSTISYPKLIICSGIVRQEFETSIIDFGSHTWLYLNSSK